MSKIVSSILPKAPATVAKEAAFNSMADQHRLASHSTAQELSRARAAAVDLCKRRYTKKQRPHSATVDAAAVQLFTENVQHLCRCKK